VLNFVRQIISILIVLKKVAIFAHQPRCAPAANGEAIILQRPKGHLASYAGCHMSRLIARRLNGHGYLLI
jgi:hypothetical protein